MHNLNSSKEKDSTSIHEPLSTPDIGPANKKWIEQPLTTVAMQTPHRHRGHHIIKWLKVIDQYFFIEKKHLSFIVLGGKHPRVHSALHYQDFYVYTEPLKPYIEN